VNIAGANSATLTINNAQATDAGTYRVIVSNGAGSITSQTRRSSSSSRRRFPCSPKTNRVAGTTRAIQRQRQRHLALALSMAIQRRDLPNQEKSQLTLNNVQPSQLATTASSSPTVRARDQFRRHARHRRSAHDHQRSRRSHTVLGGSVTFTVSATGTAPLTYQWRKNSIDIFGATSASYTIRRRATAGRSLPTPCSSATPAATALSAAAALTLSAARSSPARSYWANGAFQFTVWARANRLQRRVLHEPEHLTNLTSVTLTNTTSTVTDASATNSKPASTDSGPVRRNVTLHFSARLNVPPAPGDFGIRQQDAGGTLDSNVYT
jgi:hypothetical protein